MEEFEQGPDRVRPRTQRAKTRRTTKGSPQRHGDTRKSPERDMEERSALFSPAFSVSPCLCGEPSSSFAFSLSRVFAFSICQPSSCPFVSFVDPRRWVSLRCCSPRCRRWRRRRRGRRACGRSTRGSRDGRGRSRSSAIRSRTQAFWTPLLEPHRNASPEMERAFQAVEDLSAAGVLAGVEGAGVRKPGREDDPLGARERGCLAEEAEPGESP